LTLVADRSAGAPGTEDDDESWTPGDAAHDALRVLEVIAGVALIAAAIVIPLALLGLLAGLTLRHTRRRRREHALDAV
jgi:Kef-type K+ transport system membrane component KefB